MIKHFLFLFFFFCALSANCQLFYLDEEESFDMKYYPKRIREYD